MSEKQISEELKQKIEELKVTNIAVIGGTGVGKSTLINAVFGVDFTRVSKGLPGTQGFHRCPPEGSGIDKPIVIFDSAGFEPGKTKEFLETIQKFLDEKSDQKDIDQQIHLVWYVISAPLARVVDFDEAIIKKVKQQKIPAFIVLSQCDRASEEEKKGVIEALRQKGLYYEVDDESNHVLDLIQVAADPLIIRGKPLCEPFGLEELVEKTIEKLPDIRAEALIVSQNVLLKAKREIVWKYIAAAATTCFVAGTAPGPAGTPVLVAAQTGLCIAIASVYERKEIGEFLVSIGSVTSLNAIISSLFGDLLSSFFPPAAVPVAAGSASYVVALGLACTAVFEKMSQGGAPSKSNKEEIKKYIQDNLKEELKKYSLLRIFTPEELEIVKKNFLKSFLDKSVQF